MSKENPNYNEIIFTDEQEQKIIDLYVNQNISTVQIGKQFGCSHKKIAKVLKSYNIPRTGASRRKYYLNETFFDNIDTQDKAYILGFFYADGCNYMPKQTVSMSLQEEDYDILERIRNTIGSERPLEFIDYSNKHNFGYNYENQWRLLLFSKHICDSLNAIGMTPAKSLILEFPNIDPSLYRHFIRGYFDGDGCISLYKHPRSSITRVNISMLSTEKFLNKVKEILFDELKINCGIYDIKKNNITKTLSISSVGSCVKFLEWIYQDANLYMQRKYDKYLEYIHYKEASCVA